MSPVRLGLTVMCRRARHPGLLRIAPWQRVIGQLSAAGDLRWLVEGLEAKYGLTNSATLRSRDCGWCPRPPARRTCQAPGPGRQIPGPLVTTGFLILIEKGLRVGKPAGLTRRDLSVWALSQTRVVARDAHWRDAPARRTIVRQYRA